MTAGAAQWRSEQTALLAFPTLLSIVAIFFGQAFPEELLWRGHLAGLLRLRMGARGIITTTSLGLAVGFRTGYNALFDVVAPMPGSYWVEILTRVIVLAILATIALLAWLKLRQRPSAFARRPK